MRFATAQGDRELRFAEFGTSAVPPPVNRISAAFGNTVTQTQAVALPAVIACIRLVSETIAAMTSAPTADTAVVSTPLWVSET